MKRGCAIAVGCIASALAARAEPPIRSIAGGELTLDFANPVGTLYVEVGPTPVACALDAKRTRAACDVPTTLGPGLWPVDASFSELAAPESHLRGRRILELRVPAIVSATPHWVRPGSLIELEIEGPLPTGEPVELLILGEGYERVVEPKQLSSSRLRALLPGGDLPNAPVLLLRVRDMESEAFHGVASNRWVSFALAYGDWIGPGLTIGAVAAAAIVFSQPARRRAP